MIAYVAIVVALVAVCAFASQSVFAWAFLAWCVCVVAYDVFVGRP